jgi:hypothetical protein
MKKQQKAINSLKAYYESFIDIDFSESFLKKMIEGCSKDDVNYLVESDFSKVENCNYKSMDSYYKENYVVNLLQITLGNYDIPLEVMVEYLSKFSSIDEVKLFKPLSGTKLIMHKIKNHININFIIDNGDTTDLVTISGDKELLADVIDNLELALKDKLIMRY